MLLFVYPWAVTFCMISMNKFDLFYLICFDYLLNGGFKVMAFIESWRIFTSYQCESSLVCPAMHWNLFDVYYLFSSFFPFFSSSILAYFHYFSYQFTFKIWCHFTWLSHEENSIDFNYLVTNLRNFFFYWEHISNSH